MAWSWRICKRIASAQASAGLSDDAYGQPVRIAIADFVKDAVADFTSFHNPRQDGPGMEHASWHRSGMRRLRCIGTGISGAPGYSASAVD
jgi:hypothetical protein